MSCEEFLSREVVVGSATKDSADLIKLFIERHNNGKRNIVLVTSGGTTVPLEEKTVRFIDNFSVGTRGSASAENFLDHGYAVIFLHRRGSLQPFNRFFQHQNFLDMFQMEDADSVKLKDKWMSMATGCYKKYKEALDSDSLLNVEFTTLADYLYLLQASAEHLGKCERRAMLYLAAAVSDFYIPETKISPHKIQSSNGPLQLSLQIVPKFLQPLVKSFVPKALVVSFKLETDPSLLLAKSKRALETYNHQVVVGNILETRKREVLIVTRDSEKWIRLDDFGSHGDVGGGGDASKGKTSSSSPEIETAIISELVEMHARHLE